VTRLLGYFSLSRLWPPGNGDLTAFDDEAKRRAVRVPPERVLAFGQARIDGGIFDTVRRVPGSDLTVRSLSWRFAVGRDLTDLDLGTVQLSWRVQEQGTDAGAKLKHDTAGAGRTEVVVFVHGQLDGSS
jgi:hypothetical protein